MQVVRESSRTSIKSARALLVAVPLCLAPLGCSSLNSTTSIHKSAKATVALEEVTDWSFEASHPTLVDTATIAKALRGVQRQDAQPASTKVPVGGSRPMRVFSDEDAEFLAPLLAQALSHAKPEEIVGFRLSSSAGSGSEPTAGTLYAQRTSLYLTLTQYQGKPVKNSSSWFSWRTSDNKSARMITFNPATAGRVEAASPAVSHGQNNASTVIIDQQALARTGGTMPLAARAIPAASPAAAPLATATPVNMIEQPAATIEVSQSQAPQDAEFLNQKLEELRQAKEALGKKDTEIKVLRKESQWMKQELKERDAEIKAMKTKAAKASAKSAPKKKSAEVYRIK